MAESRLLGRQTRTEPVWMNSENRHVADLGMEHVYNKPRTPQLNGKVERSHRTDKGEFYQLLTYRDDVDLEKRLGRMGALLQLRSAARSPPR